MRTKEQEKHLTLNEHDDDDDDDDDYDDDDISILTFEAGILHLNFSTPCR